MTPQDAQDFTHYLTRELNFHLVELLIQPSIRYHRERLRLAF